MHLMRPSPRLGETRLRRLKRTAVGLAFVAGAGVVIRVALFVAFLNRGPAALYPARQT